MKKVLSLFALAGILSFSQVNISYAQDDTTGTEEMADTSATDSMNVESTTTVEEAPAEKQQPEKPAENEVEKLDFVQTLKDKFIEGGPEFMGIVLICLILGLALSIERIIYLNLATTNTRKLLNQVEEALETGGVDAAKEVCRNTSGPIASIFYQGLDRMDEGIENVEKAIVSYGGVQMGLLEKGMSWISLFIALAPMLGFMGTVIGMIQAFDEIQATKTIAPDVVAGGIKVALLTTVFGLIVAIILQIFYNYIVSKVDSLVNDMEDASINLTDLLIKYKAKKG